MLMSSYNEMLIVRHLGTPNSPFSLTSMDVTECMIQYYADQWSGLYPHVSRMNVPLIDPSPNFDQMSCEIKERCIRARNMRI